MLHCWIVSTFPASIFRRLFNASPETHEGSKHHFEIETSVFDVVRLYVLLCSCTVIYVSNAVDESWAVFFRCTFVRTYFYLLCSPSWLCVSTVASTFKEQLRQNRCAAEWLGNTSSTIPYFRSTTCTIYFDFKLKLRQSKVL